MRPLYRSLAAFVIAVVLLATDASACPNCKEAIAEQSNSSDLKSGYYYSILMMIGTPFTLVTVGIITVVQASKKGLLPEM